MSSTARDATVIQSSDTRSYAGADGSAGVRAAVRHHPHLGMLAETGEVLAGMFRPGNAGANCAADHVKVLAAAVDQLPMCGRLVNPAATWLPGSTAVKLTMSARPATRDPGRPPPGRGRSADVIPHGLVD
jgi:hypothetical protein